MPTVKEKKSTSPTAQDEAQDATVLLQADHERVSNLFAEYEKADSTAEKKQIVDQLCNELTVHTQLEEDDLLSDSQTGLERQKINSGSQGRACHPENTHRSGRGC